MDVPQFYETAIAARDQGENSDSEFRFLCLPLAAIHEANRDLVESPALLLAVLGLTAPLELSVARLSDAAFALLLSERPELEGAPRQLVQQLVVNREFLDAQRGHYPSLALFADYVAFAEVVPFEQSTVSGLSLASLAMKSYTPAAAIIQAGGTVAPHLGPHGPVVHVASAGAAGAVAVIDSIGVVVGVATSPYTHRAVTAVRRGFRRLIHRPHPQPAPVLETVPVAQASIAYQAWLNSLGEDVSGTGRPMLGDVVI